MRDCSTIPILEEHVDFLSLSSIPKEPGIYALYATRPKNHLKNVEYVGIAQGEQGIRGRIRHHLKERDTRINADRISHVSWWLHCKFSNQNKDYLRVAEQVAFDMLKPFFGKRPGVRGSQDLENIVHFERKMKELFGGDPSGCFFPVTTENLAHCISRLGDRLRQ